MGEGGGGGGGAEIMVPTLVEIWASVLTVLSKIVAKHKPKSLDLQSTRRTSFKSKGPIHHSKLFYVF